MKKLTHELDRTHTTIVYCMQMCTICCASLDFHMILDFNSANYSKCKLDVSINTISTNEEILRKHR